jgi:hypothetical protein
MKRRKLTVRNLSILFVVLICVAVLSICTVSFFQNTFLSDLLFRGCLIGVILMHKTPPMPQPTEIFTEHILDPIPNSVTNLKADRPGYFQVFSKGYIYTLRFNINRADLALIIGSQPFQRVWGVTYGRYGKGILDWNWDPPGRTYTRGGSVIVYHPKGGRREPKWFKPNQWDAPEVYAFQKVGDYVNAQATTYFKKANEQEIIQVLLYNEKDQEAYFIISNWR